MVRQMGLGKNIKISLIEDNSGDAYLIEEQLEELANFFYEIKNVGTLNEALDVLNKQLFDVILLDLVLPDSDGVSTFFRIHNLNSRIPIILLTEIDDKAIGSYAVEKGAHDFFVKGQTEGGLLQSINTCSI